MHFQEAPAIEAKLVRCTRGAIFDVVLDLRPGSPLYGARANQGVAGVVTRAHSPTFDRVASRHELAVRLPSCSPTQFQTSEQRGSLLLLATISASTAPQDLTYRWAVSCARHMESIPNTTRSADNLQFVTAAALGEPWRLMRLALGIFRRGSRILEPFAQGRAAARVARAFRRCRTARIIVDPQFFGRPLQSRHCRTCPYAVLGPPRRRPAS